MMLQGYYVLHARLDLIPQPKQNTYNVRECLCNLFLRWSNHAQQAASESRAHYELRPTSRLDALLLHTYESSTALQVFILQLQL